MQGMPLMQFASQINGALNNFYEDRSRVYQTSPKCF